MRPAARMPKLTRRSRILIAVALVGRAAAADRAAADRRLRGLAVVRRAGVPLGVHHRAGHPDHPVPGGVAADRRDRVRGLRAGLPHPAGVRPHQRAQRSGRALSHRGDVPAAADRHRHPGLHRSPRRYRRAEPVGACSCSCGGSFGVTDPQFNKDLGFYAFDLPFYRNGADLPVRGDLPGIYRQPAGPLPVRRHPAVRRTGR